MSKKRLALHGKPGFADVETDATVGAVVGRNVWNPDGTLYVPAVPASSSSLPATVWKLVAEIPAAVAALATLAAGRFIARGSAGAAEAKVISDTGLALVAAASPAAARAVLNASLPDYPNDAAAAAGGIAVGQSYRNGSVQMVRVS